MVARYQISVSTAPAKGGNGKYRRPVHIYLFDTQAKGTRWHWVRGLNGGLVKMWANVDSRYSGPKSAYGQAMQEAKELCQQLNAEQVTLIV